MAKIRKKIKTTKKKSPSLANFANFETIIANFESRPHFFCLF